MTDSNSGSVSTYDRLTRLAAGGIMIALIFNPGVDAFWLALVAVYPIITAIMAWDPFYALAGRLMAPQPSRGAALRHSSA